MDPDLLLADLTAGKTAALARAISAVENGRPGFERLLAGVHRSLGRARRIGITGPPGAGKSTLVERLVLAYRAAGLRVLPVVEHDPVARARQRLGDAAPDALRGAGDDGDPPRPIRARHASPGARRPGPGSGGGCRPASR